MKTKKSLVVLAFILLSTAIFAQRPKGKVIIEGGPFTLEQVKDSVFLSDSDCDSCNVVPSTIRAHMVGILNMYNSRSMLGQKYTEITEADLPYFFSIAVSTSAQTIKDTVWMNYALNGEMKYFKKKLTAKDGDILTINGLPFMKLKCANLLPLVLEETEEAEVEENADAEYAIEAVDGYDRYFFRCGCGETGWKEVSEEEFKKLYGQYKPREVSPPTHYASPPKTEKTEMKLFNTRQ